LNARGVITILVSTQHGFINVDQSSFEATYLADLVILLRYFEALGTVRQAISVIKNRSHDHERTIREFEVGKKGIRIGKPLRNSRGSSPATLNFLANQEHCFEIKMKGLENPTASHGPGSTVRAFRQRR